MLKDEENQEVFLKFADITKKRVEEISQSKQNSDIDIDNSSTHNQMQTKILTARVHANREIDIFRNATKEYIEKIESLCLFKGTSESVQEMMIKELLEFIVEPTVKGKKIPGMPEDMYKEFRTNMYKTLIDFYIDNK